MRDIKSCYNLKGKDLLFMHVANTDYCREHSSIGSTGMFAGRPPNITADSVFVEVSCMLLEMLKPLRTSLS